MSEIQLVKNKTELLCRGSKKKVWEHILRYYGHMTMQQFMEAGLMIETAQTIPPVKNVVYLAQYTARMKAGKK